jgi:tetratricopeptide (TPR) repeat protein
MENAASAEKRTRRYRNFALVMDEMRSTAYLSGFLVAISVLALGKGALARAQEPPPPPQQPDNPADAAPPPAAKKTLPKTNKDNATESAPDQPTWDPLRAEKDLEVGQYYMHKGDVDAAIDRFQDATLAKPGYAVPFKFLGEAQEKKGLKKPAIKSYQRYLDLYPKAEDAEKIRKRVEKLYKDVEKEKKEIK